jgi:hypothetical protein
VSVGVQSTLVRVGGSLLVWFVASFRYLIYTCTHIYGSECIPRGTEHIKTASHSMPSPLPSVSKTE